MKFRSATGTTTVTLFIVVIYKNGSTKGYYDWIMEDHKKDVSILLKIVYVTV